MKTHTLVVAGLLAMAVSAFAAERTTDWQTLKALQPGQKIEVVRTSMAKDTGKLVAVSDDDITISANQTHITIPREQVARVSTPPGGTRVVAGVLGALGGSIAGGLLAHSAAGHSHSIAVDFVGAGVGAAAGGLAGAYAIRPRTYYRQAK